MQSGSGGRQQKSARPYGRAPNKSRRNKRNYSWTCFIDREIRFRFSSTSSTTTFTTSPTLTAWEGCLRNLSVIWEMWTSPSWWTPMSTKTPKSMTLRTVPVRTIPGFRSLMLITSVRSRGGGSSSRGSRPGFCSSRTTSSRVGTPTPHCWARDTVPMCWTWVFRSPSFPAATSAMAWPVRDSSRSAAG